MYIVNNLSVGYDLIPYPILHQFFENDSVLCFPDVVWKVEVSFIRKSYNLLWLSSSLCIFLYHQNYVFCLSLDVIDMVISFISVICLYHCAQIKQRQGCFSIAGVK